MLRRKLLLIFGPLVALLTLTCVGAIVLLQDVLGQLNHISRQAWVAADEVNHLSNTISRAEVGLYRIDDGAQRRLDDLIDTFDALRAQADAVGQLPVAAAAAPADAVYKHLRGHLDAFERNVSGLATSADPAIAAWHVRAALGDAVALRKDVLAISEHAAGHAQREQRALSERFKWVVLGLSVIFLLMINLSVLVLIRTAALVLRPIDKLVTASRELGHERFDHRVDLGGNDEFGELARAYNNLAAQLQANEERKLEMLGQVALMLNHELNNAGEIIELQLGLLARRAGDPARLDRCLREIRQSLGRMSSTVEALRHVRRIVLTDYVEGTKMLDLQRSIDPAPASTPDN